MFLFNPEEAGVAFQRPEGQQGLMGPIDLGLIKRVNDFMSGLPESVKQTMISKVENFMVDCSYLAGHEPQPTCDYRRLLGGRKEQAPEEHGN